VERSEPDDKARTRAERGRRERPRKRAEQQRALATRSAILEAAVAEFAEKGFDAASIRNIADRTGFQHPLITYHYRSKDILWRAAAEYAFARIRDEWDELVPEDAAFSSLERLREEYRTLFRHTVAFPEFHLFMRQEALTNNPRLRWVAEHVLKPLLDRLLPQIRAAQREGMLPRVEPILFHYMMVSLSATLSEFGPEMWITSGLASDDPKVAKAYWRLVEETVFGTVRAGSSLFRARRQIRR
jgi:TetR/AcrR family transcriptional regulator